MGSRNIGQTENIPTKRPSEKENLREHDFLQNKETNGGPKNSRPSTPKDYVGLVNQGATCYLNAVLQTLFMTEDFRKAVNGLKGKKLKNNHVSNELKELFTCLKSNAEGVHTNKVTNALDIGNVYEQQDAAEYYQKILSMTETEPAKIFQGTEKHSTICPKQHEYIEENSFFSLAISMDYQNTTINVQKSFNACFDEMYMKGEDQMFCEICQMQTDMNVFRTISELPEVLTLHLKRFYLDYNYMTYKKNNCEVKVPLQLKVQDERCVQYIYDLYAIVNHTGSLSGGHYYADIKSFEDQQWYRFDDSMVQNMQNPFVYDEGYLISDTPYLLLFKKSESESPQNSSTSTHKQINPEDSHKILLPDAAGPNVFCSADKVISHPSNVQSETTDIKSDICLRETQQKCDTNISTKPQPEKQSKEDHHHSPAQIRAESKSPQNSSTSTHKQINPEDSHDLLLLDTAGANVSCIADQVISHTNNIQSSVQSETTDIPSDISLQETPQTCDANFSTKPKPGKQTKEDHHQSPAQIRAESKSPQNSSTSTHKQINPEDSHNLLLLDTAGANVSCIADQVISHTNNIQSSVQSETTDIPSDISLQETPQTCDANFSTKPKPGKQTKEDHHQSPAQIRGESKSPHNSSTSTHKQINPEDSHNLLLPDSAGPNVSCSTVNVISHPSKIQLSVQSETTDVTSDITLRETPQTCDGNFSTKPKPDKQTKEDHHHSPAQIEEVKVTRPIKRTQKAKTCAIA